MKDRKRSKIPKRKSAQVSSLKIQSTRKKEIVHIICQKIERNRNKENSINQTESGKTSKHTKITKIVNGLNSLIINDRDFQNG